MRTAIYYFTSTGTSLVVARDIAARTGGRLVSIPAVMGDDAIGAQVDAIGADADVIGMVFPVYYASLGGSGLPRIVERFARAMCVDKYLFAVCTHSGGPVDTIEHLDQIVRSRGGALAVGISVQTSVPYTPRIKIGHALFGRALEVDRAAEAAQQRALWAAWRQRLDLLADQIQARERGVVARRSPLVKVLGIPWFFFQKQLAIARYQALAGSSSRSMDELVPRADASLVVNERCTGCGTCARICPVGNIELVDGHPTWQHRCETCYACFQWCPQNAIGGPTVEYEKRGHHPQVRLADMMATRT